VVCSLLWQTVLIVGGLLGGLTWVLLRRRPTGPTQSPQVATYG